MKRQQSREMYETGGDENGGIYACKRIFETNSDQDGEQEFRRQTHSTEMSVWSAD